MEKGIDVWEAMQESSDRAKFASIAGELGGIVDQCRFIADAVFGLAEGDFDLEAGSASLYGLGGIVRDMADKTDGLLEQMREALKAMNTKADATV